MEFKPFGEICERLAKSETRTIISGGGDSGLPLDEYGLLEHFCTDPDCDCRSVMLVIYSRNQARIEASISFAFDRDSLFGPGICLDPCNYQGPNAKAVLKLIKQHVLTDRAYVDRIRQHYAITKQIVEGLLRPQDAPASACLSGYVPADFSQNEVDPELDELLNPTGRDDLSFMSRAERREAQREAHRQEKKLNKVR